MVRLIVSLMVIVQLALIAWVFASDNDNWPTNTPEKAVSHAPEAKSNTDRLNEISKLPAVEVKRFEFKEGENSGEMVVVKLKKNSFKARLMENVSSPRYLNQWAKECENCLVVNGGYFMENYKSAGFLQVDGVRENPEGMYDQHLSGMIILDEGEISLRDLKVEPIVVGLNGLDNALQSYPFLLKNGGGAIREDSGKLGRRTALGKDVDGHTYLVLVDQSHLSLYRFMEELLKTGIDFEHVINLDGGPSSGMIANVAEKTSGFHNYSAVPNVIIFDFLK